MAVREQIVFLLLAFTSWVGGEDYHPERTLLIDVYPSKSPVNFLFRGNMPIINGSFAYSQITSTMITRLQSQGYTIQSNFTLVVVSYLNPFEEKDLSVERKYFEGNLSRGEFHNIIITGTFVPPPKDSPELVKALRVIYDDLPKLTKKLRDMLTQHQGPALIYTHCEAGTDRTGEVSGAYYLKYLNMSFSAALEVDNHVQNRDMYKSSRNALQWYCFYLLNFENFTKLNCTVPDEPRNKNLQLSELTLTP